jgi:hypothetical protein
MKQIYTFIDQKKEDKLLVTFRLTILKAPDYSKIYL